jgi:pimeloyl-ACP methyl ester carboxylesterase
MNTSVAVRRIRRSLLVIAAFLVVIYLGLLIGFSVFKSNYFGALEDGSRVVNTSLGPIEFARVGKGPEVLMLHGTPGGYDQGMLVAENLVPAGFGVISASRPGYLRTPVSTGPTMDQAVAAYAALLDTLGVDRVAVVGGSGGGPAAIAMAAKYPDRIWAVGHLFGLAGGLPPGDDAPPPPPALGQRLILTLFGDGFVEWALLNLNRRFPASLLYSEGFGMINEDARQRLFSDPGILDRFDTMLWTGYSLNREAGRDLDVEQFRRLDQGLASTILAPAFFIHGTDDNNAPFELAQTLAGRMPNAEFHAVAGADHWMAVTRPEDVYPPLIDFLRRHAPAAIQESGR